MQPLLPSRSATLRRLGSTIGPVPGLQQADDVALLFADKLTYGATPALVGEISAKTPTLWLEEQLRPELIAEDVELEATLATFPTLHYTGYAKRQSSGSASGLRELQLAMALRGARSNRHLLEVMTGFWHDHFNVGFGNSTLMWFAADYDRAVRGQALGTFRELLRATAQSAAMMIYLNNNQSRWPNPNENYAREVMELHTLGVDGGYTEDDVKQVALALTGWGTTSLNAQDMLFGFAFHPEWHYDEGPIQVMDWTAQAQGGEAAIAQGESLLDHLARHPSTARFLSRKLVQRFLGDGDHAMLVERLAEVYLVNDTAIGPWLRTLVASDAFLASRGAKLRRPLEHLLLQLRVVEPAMLAEGGHRSQLSGGLNSLMRRLGHEAFTWPTPDGHPDDADHWAASGSVLARWNGSLDIMRDRVAGLRFDVGGGLRSDVGDGTVGELLDGLAATLLVRPLDDADRDALLRFTGSDRGAPASDLDDQTFRHLVALVLSVPAAQIR